MRPLVAPDRLARKLKTARGRCGTQRPCWPRSPDRFRDVAGTELWLPESLPNYSCPPAILPPVSGFIWMLLGARTVRSVVLHWLVSAGPPPAQVVSSARY